MTSNGSEEVNQSQNQTSKVQNGMKCADSMPSTLNTAARRSNRNNNMGLKRVRSVDSIAGMFVHSSHEFIFYFFVQSSSYVT